MAEAYRCLRDAALELDLDLIRVRRAAWAFHVPMFEATIPTDVVDRLQVLPDPDARYSGFLDWLRCFHAEIRDA